MKKLSLAIVLVACGTDQRPAVDTVPGLTVPPPPDNGVQLITPIFENIQPGSDLETCVWTDKIFTEETDVKSTIGYQNEPPGHHVVLFYTLDKQPPGTSRVCTDTDMASFRYITGNGNNGSLNEAPGDLVFKIPAGAQLVLNAHYLNASDDVLPGQSIVNVNFADAGVHRASGSLAIVDTTLDVPPGVSTMHMSCTYDRQFKLWYFIPHMHRWGSHITIHVTHAETAQEMSNLDWEPQYTFHPPESRYDLTEPFTVNAGDKIDIDCTWDNTEAHDLPFGFEMCVAFAQYIDESGWGGRACDHGSWTDF